MGKVRSCAAGCPGAGIGIGWLAVRRGGGEAGERAGTGGARPAGGGGAGKGGPAGGRCKGESGTVTSSHRLGTRLITFEGSLCSERAPGGSRAVSRFLSSIASPTFGRLTVPRASRHASTNLRASLNRSRGSGASAPVSSRSMEAGMSGR